MNSGDVDLRRQAMFTTMQQNNADVDIIWEENSRDPNLTEHQQYITKILQKLVSEPDDIFKINCWTKWIKRVSVQKGETEKFRDKTVLLSFAECLLEMFCDKDNPYIKQIRKKLDDDQWKRLLKLIEIREAKEYERLVVLANSPTLSESPVNISSSSDDDEEVDAIDQCNWKRAPGRNQLYNQKGPDTSLKRIKEGSSSPDRVFQDLNNLSSEPEKEKRDFQQFSKRRTSMVPITAKRRNSTNRPFEFKVDSLRKKPRNDQPNYRPLDIKVNTKKLKLTPPQVFPPNKFKLGPTISPKNLTDDFLDSIKDENPTDSSFFEKSIQCPEYDDEVIENPTPPCSPACTAVIERSEVSVGTSINEDLENVAPKGNSVGSSSNPVLTKDLPSNSKIQRLKTGEIPSENRRIKGIAPRINSQTSYSEPPTNTINGTVTINDGDSFELPDIEPTIDQDKENYPNNIDEIAIKYPKPPSAPALTLEMFEELKRTLERPPKDRVVYGFNLNILQEDLALFSKDNEWLIDMNIDFYLELIKERSVRPGYPSVYIFHSFFYTLLTDGGYHVVEETTGEDDIFKYDLVFFPVNLSQHWRLVVVEFPFKTLRCFDSMPHDNSEVLKHIGKYLRQEYHRKYRRAYSSYYNSSSEDDTSCPPVDLDKPEPKSTRMFFESWNAEDVPSDTIPQQKNAIDCGVFVLQYAEYLSRMAEFDFDQTHIPYFRKRMMYETLTKTLLTTMPDRENISKS